MISNIVGTNNSLHGNNNVHLQNWDIRRHYPPLSLGQLQMMVDTRRIDPLQPIDLTIICNTFLFKISPKDRQFGFHLTAEGIVGVIQCFCRSVYAKEWFYLLYR